MSNYYIQNGELKHYGILGMKWGVRRSSAQLAKTRDKLGNKNAELKSKVKSLNERSSKYTAKSEKFKAKNSKHQSRIVKATAKKAKYDRKLNKALSKSKPDANKVAKLTAKTVKYQNKINKSQSKLKFNKWQVKADAIHEEARKAQEKIQKNSNLMNVYNNTISAIDNGTIQKGKYFMRYVDDE